MTFLHLAMLAGLAAITLPILIHLLNRNRARVVDWGAMRFLRASVATQNRRILVEEMVLLALRCLLVALVVLAMARPFLPTKSFVPWAVVLPAALAAALAAGMAAALWHAMPQARRLLLAVSALLLVLAGVATLREARAQGREWPTLGSGTDLALVIDSSLSMTLQVSGKSNFARAVDEARGLVEAARPADAFSVIAAGPVPVPALPSPVSNRRAIFDALDQLSPTGGPMGVLEALNAAAASLAEGRNAGKKILLFTDGQSAGWGLRQEVRWRFLSESLKKLPTEPKLLLRTLPMPAYFVNAAVADLSFSRKIVGTDRPLGIDVRILNASAAPIQPSAVEFQLDTARIASERLVKEILPGASETVHFQHRFEKPGRRILSAKLTWEDDLPGDNTVHRVLEVSDRLPVLLVDGAPSARPLDSASAFIEFALTPSSASGEGDSETPARFTGPAALPVAQPRSPARAGDFLIAPDILPATDIAALSDFSSYAVVILANVPRLPERAADALARFVHQGGGLLIAPGDRAAPAFYNEWLSPTGKRLLPARLGQHRTALDDPARLGLKTFSHPSLSLVSQPAHSDLETTLIKSYWELEADEKDTAVRVGARLDNGLPWLVERKYGKGFFLLASISLDRFDTNLPSLQCFVPLVHELVYFLAAPMAAKANLEPGSEFTLELPPRPSGDLPEARPSARGTGLKAEYFDNLDFTNLKVTRTDPAVDFNWGLSSPDPAIYLDEFSVRWTGQVQAPSSGFFTFYTYTDDGARLWIDGRLLLDQWKDQTVSESTGTIRLDAGRKYDLRLEYYDRSLDAVAKLFWSSSTQPKELISQKFLFPTPGVPSSSPGAPGPETREFPVQVVTPSARRLPAKAFASGRALRLRFSATHEPGLYQFLLPPEAAEHYQAGPEASHSIPFVVLSHPDESHLNLLTEAELETARTRVGLFAVKSHAELVAAVTGGVPGEELWRYLALGALLTLLAETALARWIALKRRLHQPGTVSFGPEIVDLLTFRNRARDLLKIPASKGNG